MPWARRGKAWTPPLVGGPFASHAPPRAPVMSTTCARRGEEGQWARVWRWGFVACWGGGGGVREGGRACKGRRRC